MRITAIDNQTLNGPEGLTCRYLGGHGPVAINTQSRDRAGLHPVVDSFSQGQRQATLQVYKQAGVTMHPYDLNELVHEIFYPPLGKRTLAMEYDGDLYTTECYVTSLEMPNDTLGVRWLVNITIPSGLWHAAESTTATESPVIVTGNVPALPKLSITGGQPVTRQRVTITDRTGHGVSAYLVSVEPQEALSEANYRIWANGLEIPFAYAGGRLFFRVDCPPPPERVFVDIYQGASINNTVYAGALDPAGLSLDSGLASGSVTVSVAGAARNPLAPSLAWRPGVSYKHESQRPYQYGLDGDSLMLVDTDVVGDAPGLAGDADSFIIVTGCEAERIRNLNMTIHAGYQPSEQEAGAVGGSTRRVMRVIIKKFNQGSGHYAQWTLGLTTFPDTRVEQRTFEDEETGIVTETDWWFNDYTVDQFMLVCQQYLPGVTVTQGQPGWYYLDFGEGPPDIPLLSMSVSSKDVTTRRYTNPDEGGDETDWPIRGTNEKIYRGTMDYTLTDRGEPPVVVFEALWVDPVTLEPLADNPETADLLPDPIRGQSKAVVKYRTRDSEHWITAWERVVTGNGRGGTTVSLSGISVDTPGAVEIAVGLEPVAKRFSQADWGRLSITSDPVIDLDTSKTPQPVVSAAIDALHIGQARIRNARNGDTVTLQDALCDGGIDIDTSELVVEGYNGVGPVYLGLNTNRGAAMFQLVPGENVVDVSGDLDEEDVTVTFRERLAV